MKRLLILCTMMMLIFSGCGGIGDEIDRVLILRQKLQETGCSFLAEITADYGDSLYSFSMECRADENGDVSFCVIQPETISGITGKVSDTGGNLTFDDHVLLFETLADDQVTPVTAPWLLIRTLRGGYIRACTETEAGMKLIIDDSYEEDSLQLDIWLDGNDLPSEAEILWKGRRIISLIVKDFSYE